MAMCLSPNEWRVLLCVIRLSYGFRAKTARITGARVATMTGMHEQHVSATFKRLVHRNLIVRSGKRIGVQKDWERWLSHEQKSQGPVTSEHETESGTDESNRSLLPKVTRGCEELNALKKRIKKQAVAPLRPPSSEGEKTVPVSDGEASCTPDKGAVQNAGVRQVFAGLKERRGWTSPMSAAEAKAIRWMLGEGYTPEDILGCYDYLAGQGFWRDKPLFMMSVKKDIGLWRQRQATPQEVSEWPVR